MKPSTRSQVRVANSTEYTWTPFDLIIETNVHVHEGIVASHELLLSVDDAKDLIQKLALGIAKFESKEA